MFQVNHLALLNVKINRDSKGVDIIRKEFLHVGNAKELLFFTKTKVGNKTSFTCNFMDLEKAMISEDSELSRLSPKFYSLPIS